MERLVWVSYTVLLILCTCTASNAFAEDFKTTDGKEYKNVTVSRVEPDGIVVTTSYGVSKLYFVELPQEVGTKYGYDAAKAAAYSEASAKARQEAVRQNVSDEQTIRLRQQLDEMRARGLTARVKIKQILTNGIRGEAEYFESGTYDEIIKVFGTALDTQPRNEIVKKQYSAWKPLGLIFVQGVGQGMADGDVWEGKLWPGGTYHYGRKTIHRYAQSPEEAIVLEQDADSR